MRLPNMSFLTCCFRVRGAALTGQVAAMFVCFLLVLVAFVGLAVDFAGANREKTMQDQVLEIVKDTVFSEGEKIKFSGEPQNVVFDSVEKVLSSNGFDGQAECLFYEVHEGYPLQDGSSTMGRDRRVLGCYVILSGSYKPSFLSVAGVTDIPISGKSMWTMDFYSASNVVWRPDHSLNDLGRKAVWSFVDGTRSSAPVVTSIIFGTDSVPVEFRNAIETTVNDV